MKFTRAFFFLAAFFSLVLSGCSQRLDQIDEKIADMQQRTSLIEAKTGGPIGNDRELLEGQKLADVRSQLTTLRNDVTVLTGKAEALEFENKRISARTDAIAQDLEQKLKELSKARPAEARAESTPSGANVDADYEAGLKAHQDGEYAKAEKLFESFVSKHPKSPLADHAIYWIGDGYMSQKTYKKAIAKFQDLIDRFPKSEKRCDAMSKQIDAFNQLGMKKEAGVFTQVRDSECK
ncbi:MAG: domain lipoprotein [Bacteriovoracaceae bacterium]|nr:domain lipoprotein [Bacteriovoracaceae bacterium]